MARNVEDLALMISVISGFDTRDPLSSPESVFPVVDFQMPTDLTEIKIGFSTDLGVALVDDNIRAVFESRK